MMQINPSSLQSWSLWGGKIHPALRFSVGREGNDRLLHLCADDVGLGEEGDVLP